MRRANTARHREGGTNNIVLGDSQVRNLGTELSNIRKVRLKESSFVLSWGGP